MSFTLKPSYVLKAGTAEFSFDTMGPLIALDIRKAKNGGADELAVLLGQTPLSGISPGDDVTLELGWDVDTTLVFTGAVERVMPGIGRTEIIALGSQALLAHSRGDTTYVSQSAGQVVSALADDAGVDVDTTADGIDLPQYLSDSRRSHYDHCLELARRCGFDLYCTEEGKLVFAPFGTTSADHTFRFGAEILAADIFNDVPLDTVSVVPESPSSSQGSDSASWFVKDPSSSTGQASGGGASASGVLLLSDPVLRSKDAADTAAKARLYLSSRNAQGGTVELMGNADVTLGQAVELQDLPEDGADGTYQVLAVRHILSRGKGFRTFLTLGGMP